jgi:hypothetical protein
VKVYVALRTQQYEGDTLLGAKPTLEAAQQICVDYAKDIWNDETPPDVWAEQKVHNGDPGTKRWVAEGAYFDYGVVEIEMEDE